MRLLGPIFSLLLLLCTAFQISGGQAPRPVQSPSAPRFQTISQAVLPQDVHLRKMHLVRPDLIHYPLCIEVFC